jgi:multiple sugar transport system substrate-binding protein
MVNLPEQDRFEWGLTDVPTGPSGRFTPAVGSAFGLTTKAKNPEAAWIVLNAFLSSAGHRFFLQMPPSRLSTFDANLKALKADEKVIADSKRALQDYATSDGVLKRPTTQKVVDTAKPIWDRVRSGALPLEDALEQIRDRLTPIVKDNA